MAIHSKVEETLTSPQREDEHTYRRKSLVDHAVMIVQSFSPTSHGQDLRQIAELEALSGLTVASYVQSQTPDLSFDLIASEAERLRSNNPLEDALKKSSNAHLKALEAEGLSTRTLEILNSWVELQVMGRMLQNELQRDQLADYFATATPGPKQASLSTKAKKITPDEMLSAAELGKRLRVSDETIRRREKEHRLFSILFPSRDRGRLYPAFQAWPGVAGKPLELVLEALDGEVGSSIYGFFVAPNDLLGNLSPVEALCGQALSTSPPDTAGILLDKNQEDRLNMVISAAKSYVFTQ